MKYFSVMMTFILAMGFSTRVIAVPNVWGVWSWEISEPVHVIVVPDGGGNPLSAAVTSGGSVVDATIRIQLWVDANDIPGSPPDPQVVPDFPREDLWLEVPGMSACLGGTIADGNTDEEGWFTFSTSPAMGGANDPGDIESYPYVMVSGSALADEEGRPIRPSIVFNSPDLNADHFVNLTDVQVFAEDFWGQYHFRSDFIWDGRLNLSDIVPLAAAQGSSCDSP